MLAVAVVRLPRSCCLGDTATRRLVDDHCRRTFGGNQTEQAMSILSHPEMSKLRRHSQVRTHVLCVCVHVPPTPRRSVGKHIRVRNRARFLPGHRSLGCSRVRIH